jgi:hypothetical protein
MATNFDVILPGYPQPVGAKIQYVVDHAGPLSYTTGGETYSVSNIGAGGFDHVEGGTSYGVLASTTAGTYSVSAIIASGSGGTGVPTVKLKWTTVGASEVSAGTNLNGQYVRLNIFAY